VRCSCAVLGQDTVSVAMPATLTLCSIVVLISSIVVANAVDDSLDNSVLKSRVQCTESKPLEAREEQANVIFTGTIRGLYGDRDHPGLRKAEVEVKRVMKGHDIVDTLPGAWTNSVWKKKMVTVAGIDDSDICDSNVREYDTRIFLMNIGSNGELRLNSSLLRLTLNNIDHADAAVKGKTPRMLARSRQRTLVRSFMQTAPGKHQQSSHSLSAKI